MNAVLDASAMIAYLDGEPGGTDVLRRLTDPNATCYAHILNLCEVYYHFVRQAGQAAGKRAIAVLQQDGLTFRYTLNAHNLRFCGIL